MAMAAATNVRARALRRAAQVLGSVEALREHLQVSMKQLSRWMGGEAWPPDEVFLRVVDLLADDDVAMLKQSLRNKNLDRCPGEGGD